MKNTLAILLLLVLTAGDLCRMGYLFNYIAHFDTYKNELCENKLNKKLKCNGMCHLSKEMASTKLENSNQNQEKNNSLIELKEPLNFLVEKNQDFSDLTKPLTQTLQYYKMPNWHYLFGVEIFHPPCA